MAIGTPKVGSLVNGSISGTESSPNTGTTDVPYPAGVVVGDFLAIEIPSRPPSQTALDYSASGWTLLKAVNGANTRVSLLYRFATSADVSATQVAVTGHLVLRSMKMIAVPGVDPTTPIDVAPTYAQGGAASTLVTIPSQTPTVADTMLLWVVSGFLAAGRTWTARQNGSQNNTNAVEWMDTYQESPSATNGRTGGGYYETWPTATATGSRGAVTNTSAVLVGIMVTLRPAPELQQASRSFAAAGASAVTGTVRKNEDRALTVTGSGGLTGTKAKAARVAFAVAGGSTVAVLPRKVSSAGGAVVATSSLFVQGRKTAQSGVVVTGGSAMSGVGRRPGVPELQPGLVYWLDATKVDGTGPVADGSPVSSWVDATGKGTTFTAPSSAGRPVYRLTGGPNSMPALEFSGAQSMAMPSAPLSGQPVSVYVVIRDRAPSTGSSVWNQTSTTSSTPVTALDLAFASGTGPLVRFFRRNDAGVLSLTSEPVSGTVARIVSGVHEVGQAVQGWVTGKLMRNAPTATADAVSSTNVSTIGARVSAAAGSVGQTTQFMDGFIAEVIVYGAAHTQAQREQVEDYLAVKYGLTLVRGGRTDFSVSAASALSAPDYKGALSGFAVTGGSLTTGAVRPSRARTLALSAGSTMLAAARKAATRALSLTGTSSITGQSGKTGRSGLSLTCGSTTTGAKATTRRQAVTVTGPARFTGQGMAYRESTVDPFDSGLLREPLGSAWRIASGNVFQKATGMARPGLSGGISAALNTTSSPTENVLVGMTLQSMTSDVGTAYGVVVGAAALVNDLDTTSFYLLQVTNTGTLSIIRHAAGGPYTTLVATGVTVAAGDRFSMVHRRGADGYAYMTAVQNGLARTSAVDTSPLPVGSFHGMRVNGTDEPLIETWFSYYSATGPMVRLPFAITAGSGVSGAGSAARRAQVVVSGAGRVTGSGAGVHRSGLTVAAGTFTSAGSVKSTRRGLSLTRPTSTTGTVRSSRSGSLAVAGGSQVHFDTGTDVSRNVAVAAGSVVTGAGRKSGRATVAVSAAGVVTGTGVPSRRAGFAVAAAGQVTATVEAYDPPKQGTVDFEVQGWSAAAGTARKTSRRPLGVVAAGVVQVTTVRSSSRVGVVAAVGAVSATVRHRASAAVHVGAVGEVYGPAEKTGLGVFTVVASAGVDLTGHLDPYVPEGRYRVGGSLPATGRRTGNLVDGSTPGTLKGSGRTGTLDMGRRTGRLTDQPGSGSLPVEQEVGR